MFVGPFERIDITYTRNLRQCAFIELAQKRLLDFFPFDLYLSHDDQGFGIRQGDKTLLAVENECFAMFLNFQLREKAREIHKRDVYAFKRAYEYPKRK